MILLVHMVFGTAVGYLVYLKSNNFLAAALAALLSHYLADLLPHIEYLHSTEKSIENLKKGNLKQFFRDLKMVILDFSIGLLIIFLLSYGQFSNYIFALAAITPDGLTVLSKIFPNKLLSLHNKLHTEKIHYLTKKKKFSLFWKILNQILIGSAAVFFLI